MDTDFKMREFRRIFEIGQKPHPEETRRVRRVSGISHVWESTLRVPQGTGHATKSDWESTLRVPQGTGYVFGQIECFFAGMVSLFGDVFGNAKKCIEIPSVLRFDTFLSQGIGPKTLNVTKREVLGESTLREPRGTGFVTKSALRLLFIVSTLILLPNLSSAQGIEVIIKEGPAPVINKRVEERLSSLLANMNSYANGNSTSIGQGLPSNMTSGEGKYGLEMLSEIIDSTGIVCEEATLETNLISLVDGNYEVRGIKVFMSKERASGSDREQELVLEFEPSGVMYNARLAMPTERYDEILSYSMDVQDEYRRKKLIHLLERFRTAYNMKDIDFIENIFDDNALIIIGRRITAEKAASSAAVNEERKSDFELIKKSKSEYIDHLRGRVFKQASFINLEFENIFIYQHPQYSDVYGINLFQKWRSDTYSDDGYLFLMIDYENELEPKIYVRAWQPEPFNDGSVIDMDMFTLVK